MKILELLKKKKQDKSIIHDIDGLFNDDMDYSKQIREREFWRNLLYYSGEQWIEYVRSLNSFRRRQLPDFIPTPVSNEIRGYVRAVKAMLLGQKLIPKIFPNTNDRSDMDAAKLGEQLLIWMDSINDEEIQEEKEKVIIWMTICGTGFLRTFPEMDGGQWALTKSGEMLKTGEIAVENIIPFNIKVDSVGDSLRKKRWIGIQSLKPKEWVEDTFKVKLQGNDETRTIDYEKRLMKLVGQVSPWKGYGLEFNTTNTSEDDLVLFKEIEFKPTNAFPNGRYIVTCREQVIIDIDRLPIKTEKGKWYYSITDFHFNYVPGRFWSDSGVNDLISAQNAINEIDQALIINRKGLGRPRIITPGEIGLKRISEGGQGFVAITYDPLMSGGQQPRIESGTPLPAQVLEERRINKEQIQDLSGDPKNILRGRPPSARSSGVQIDILRETAEKGQYPDIDRFNRALTRVYKKRLLLVKEVYTEERTLKIVGQGDRISVKAFRAADLRNNTDVRLEVDSGLATTKAGQTAMIMDVAGKGFLGNIGENPEIRQQLLRKLGLSGFSEQVNTDYERAQTENNAIAADDVTNIFLVEDPNNPDSEILNDDPLFKYDNHAIHYEVIRRFILSAEFRFLPAKAQTVAINHADIHHTMMMAEIQMQEQKMLAAQGGGGGETGTLPPPESGMPPSPT